MGKIGEQLTIVAMSIIGLAIVAVIVSPNALTGGVLGALGGNFQKSLRAALSPVVGGNSL